MEKKVQHQWNGGNPRKRWRQSRNSVKVGWSFKWPDERVWAKKCMEHEWDWPVFGNPLIDECGKRCRVGKNSKERATWAFFVTASGEKDTRTVVGRSLNQRCFKSLKNNSRLCKCDYFSSSRAWMSSEIFEFLSRSTNWPRHTPVSWQCTLSPQLAYQPLLEYEDGFAGIIKLWKVKRKGKLMSAARSTDRKQRVKLSSLSIC